MLNKIDINNVLSEYPRPQLWRDSYINLNGLWNYCVANENEPLKYTEKIIVPFSPECELSGEVTAPKPSEYLWYKKEFTMPKNFNKGKILLHFGAVDWHATVILNGEIVGEHKGGYTSFYFDITQYLKSEGNVLVVKVFDPQDTAPQTRGKQKINSGGIWYTPQSGIWQTVWLESVPSTYIQNVDITPDFENAKAYITVKCNEDITCEITIDEQHIKARCNEKTEIDMPNFIAWDINNPHLYNVEVKAESDYVKTYFAMRTLNIKEDSEGIKRLYLNGKECFCNGVLDQGYWQDGLYTAPSDEALIYDIVKMKELGFNTLRKHIKIEPMRWYYHCDRLGMMVWQDMINGGGDYKLSVITAPAFLPINIKDSNYKAFARQDECAREDFYTEMTDMINMLKNCPCVVMWVPFNEGWGQFDAQIAYDMIKNQDDTRLIDHASGWHDQGAGDFKSLHIYFRKYKYKKDKLNRAVILSEFGGYAYKESDAQHVKRAFSYKNLQTREDFVSAVRNLYKNEIIPAKAKGLCACIYTQLSDVEQEINGILSFDRTKSKISADEIKDIFDNL